MAWPTLYFLFLFDINFFGAHYFKKTTTVFKGATFYKSVKEDVVQGCIFGLLL